jgi:hypothetical protein
MVGWCCRRSQRPECERASWQFAPRRSTSTLALCAGVGSGDRRRCGVFIGQGKEKILHGRPLIGRIQDRRT